MGLATSVKEKIILSVPDRSCAWRPGSMVCAYLRCGGSGAAAVCRAPGVNERAGCCAWGASGKAEPSIAPDIPVAVCVMPTPVTAREKRRRRQQIRKDSVKTPLRFQNSFHSSLSEREEADAKAGQVAGPSSCAVLYL